MSIKKTLYYLYPIISIPFLQFVKEFVAVPTLSSSNVPIAFYYHFPYLLIFTDSTLMINNLLFYSHINLIFSNTSNNPHNYK